MKKKVQYSAAPYARKLRKVLPPLPWHDHKQEAVLWFGFDVPRE